MWSSFVCVKTRKVSYVVNYQTVVNDLFRITTVRGSTFRSSTVCDFTVHAHVFRGIIFRMNINLLPTLIRTKKLVENASNVFSFQLFWQIPWVREKTQTRQKTESLSYIIDNRTNKFKYHINIYIYTYNNEQNNQTECGVFHYAGEVRLLFP